MCLCLLVSGVRQSESNMYICIYMCVYTHIYIYAFGLWCWRRPLRVPWTARRSNQSILKEISPEYSLEGLMRKLKLQCFGHLMQRTDSFARPWCWERLKMGGEGDNSGWDGEMASWHPGLEGHEFEEALGVGDGQGSLVCCSLWGHKELDLTEPLNWTDEYLSVTLLDFTTLESCLISLFIIWFYIESALNQCLPNKK